jgi:alpha-mannosidase
MSVATCTVLLPCHSLEDFPSWSDGEEASSLLAAWTAAWHPRLLSALGRLPDWASIDSPPGTAPESLLIVPAAHDDRLHGSGFPASGTRGLDLSAGGPTVRRLGSREEIVAAALDAFDAPEAGRQQIPLSDDFHALGLAWLWSELLARRMRSTAGLERTDFASRAVEAARLAVAGDEAAAREALGECFGLLEASRKRYYPVDIWLVDLVLLAETTSAAALAREVASPLPSGFVASGEVIAALAAPSADVLRALGARIAAGEHSGCGGLWDDQPLCLMTPEAIRQSFGRGMAAWRDHIGEPPRVFARRSGAGSAILAQMLASLGYAGAIWQSFDGARVPTTGGSRVRWEACQGTTMEVLGRSAADARSPAAGVSLHDTLGEILDSDHAAILPFARYPETAAEWFEDLRRIAGWSDVFGRFVAPHDLFPQTASAATRLTLAPDRFPDEAPRLAGRSRSRPLPESTENESESPLDAAIHSTIREARTLWADEERRVGLVGERSDPFDTMARRDAKGLGQAEGAAGPDRLTPRSGGGAGRARRGGWPGLFGRWSGSRRGWRPGEPLPLDNGRIRVELHPLSGGILAVRSGPQRSNRLSQRLSLRTTRPASGRWEDPLDRSDYAMMVADSLEPLAATGGVDGEPAPGPRGERGREADCRLAAVARGRLCAGDGRLLGRFVQRVSLLPDLPLAEIDIEIELQEGIPPIESGRDATAWFERYAACRFAWNENDPVDLFRGLHTQAVATERTILASPYFLELREGDGPAAQASRWSPDDTTRITILPLGLPWHVRSSPHMLDTLLLGAGETRCRRRLAVGLGLERPWETAASLLLADGAVAEPRPAAAFGADRSSVAFKVQAGPPQPLTIEPPARLTGGEPIIEAGRMAGMRVGVLATGAAAARPRLSSVIPLQAAHVVDASGRRLRELEIEGQTVVVPLDRYEWALVDLRWEPSQAADAAAIAAGQPEPVSCRST